MKTKIEDAIFVVCDVETTGTSPRFDKIIEISLVKILNGKIIDQYSTLVNPEKYIPSYITSLTGIRNEDVIDAPKFGDISSRVRTFLEDSIFVAHNSSFDYNFVINRFLELEEVPPQNKTICTRMLSRRIIPGLISYSLSSLSAYFNIKNLRPHRSLSDALTTSYVFLNLIEELKNTHKIKTVDELISFQFKPVNISLLSRVKSSLVNMVTQLPRKPGVYIFKDRKGKIVYIGKAKNLKSRVLSYFKSDADYRVKKIIRSAHSLEFIETSTELSAFLLESELIKLHKPIHNKVLKIVRRYSFIALNENEKFPRLEITTKLSGNGTMFFGPFYKRETAEKILEILLSSTLLRECDDKTFNKKRSCYLLDIKRCLGPCINENVNIEYDREIKVVKSFLTGDNLTLLNRLIEKMKELSNRQKYEEASVIRNSINAIVSNIGKLKVLKEPINSINAIIVIFSGQNPIELIALKEGVVHFIRSYDDDIEYLESIVEDYFAKTDQYFDSPINIEKIKIIANYLVSRKSNYKIIYTTQLSREELLLQLRRILGERL